MPWSPADATRHTKSAKTKSMQSKWSKIANGVLKKSGDEASAIKIANAAMHGPGHKLYGGKDG